MPTPDEYVRVYESATPADNPLNVAVVDPDVAPAGYVPVLVLDGKGDDAIAVQIGEGGVPVVIVTE